MTDTNELRALLERATKGPWETQEPLGSDAGDGLWIVQAGLKPHEWNPLAIVYSDDLDEPPPRIGVLERDANAALFANVKKIAAAYLASAERVATLEAEVARLREADSYAAWQQKRGMIADKIDWAINEYEQFMLDDAYDTQRVLDRIIQGLREVRARAALESARS